MTELSTFTKHFRASSATSTPGFLFGHNSDLNSVSAMKERGLILKFLREYIADCHKGIRLERRLDSVYQTISWWNSVGCEVCFVTTGKQRLDHSLERCTMTKYSKRAISILHWLGSLALPRSLRCRGTCSMCTHTWHPCGDVCVADTISLAGCEDEQSVWISEYDAVTNSDGHCERKPAVRRVIAALCAYNDQFIGKLIVKMALDQVGANLTVRKHARYWFLKHVYLIKTSRFRDFFPFSRLQYSPFISDKTFVLACHLLSTSLMLHLVGHRTRATELRRFTREHGCIEMELCSAMVGTTVQLLHRQGFQRVGHFPRTTRLHRRRGGGTDRKTSQ
jgi:hypothetical protein